MTDDDFTTYWVPARFKLGYLRSVDAQSKTYSAKLAELLGLPYPEVGYWRHIELTEEMKHTLKLLVGPHRETIIKIIEARKVSHD